MKLALAQEISEGITKGGNAGIITKLSNDLKAYFRDKDYGDGLKEFYIAIICIAPEFDFFFKVRKPKYKRGKSVLIGKGGAPYDLEDNLTYDIKLDYQQVLNATESEFRKILTGSIIESFKLLDTVKKIPASFDRRSFIAEAIAFLSNYSVQS